MSAKTLLDRARPFLILAAVFGLCSWISPRDAEGRSVFLTPVSQSNLLRAVSEFGILAAGMSLVILAGGIDLSVGSILGFSAVLSAWLLVWKDIPPAWAIPATLAAGALFGAANGLLVAVFRIQPFVVTLAMMVIARGLAKLLTGGVKVSTSFMQGDAFVTKPVPPVFDLLTERLWGVLPAVGAVFLAAIAIAWFSARCTRFGRHLYAIGGNEEAARLAGIRVQLAKTAVYALSGLAAAAAGICHAAQEQQGDPEAGTTYELDAIAAVVIGGTALSGGRGSVGLTLIGVLTLGYIDQILSLQGFEQSQRLITKGAIILGAVLLQKRA